MCVSQQASPAYQPVTHRQSYKLAAAPASPSPTDTVSVGRRSQGNIGVGDSILEVGGTGGRQLVGGDQKLLPDLGSKNTVGGDLDLGQPIGSLARSGQGGTGTAAKALRTRDFKPWQLGKMMQAN